MRKLTFVLTSILIMLASQIVSANESVRIETKVDSSLKTKILTSIKTLAKLEKEKEPIFTIDGTITSVSETFFVVDGQTILIDPSKVLRFHQLGILSTGERVKVKVVVIDAINYAQDVNVIGTGQGKFQVRVDSSGNGQDMDKILEFFRGLFALFTMKVG